MKTFLPEKNVISKQNMVFLPDIKSRRPAAYNEKKDSLFRGHVKENERTSAGSSKEHVFSKDDVARFRNSLKHNICTDMLRKGFHESFSELFALIQKERAAREAAEPGSATWLRRPLEEQPEKLLQLQHFLTAAETARRAGRHEEVYEKQLALARCFTDPEDSWMCHHFYRACLNTAEKVQTDGAKRLAEANFNMGRLYEVQGELEAALDHYKAFYELTAETPWTTEEGETYRSQACESLWRTYTLLADKMLENEQRQAALESLLKAFEMAQGAGKRKIEGEAAYRIGVAYQHEKDQEMAKRVSVVIMLLYVIGVDYQHEEDQEMAKRYLNMYLEIATELGDCDSLGKAYMATAKSLEREGKLNETIQLLEKIVESSQDSNNLHYLQEACMYLGMIFNSRGRYDEACEYYQKAYSVAESQDDTALLQKAQAHVGSARARRMLPAYTGRVAAARGCDLQELLAWKQSRNDMFSHESESPEHFKDRANEMIKAYLMDNGTDISIIDLIFF